MLCTFSTFSYRQLMVVKRMKWHDDVVVRAYALLFIDQGLLSLLSHTKHLKYVVDGTPSHWPSAIEGSLRLKHKAV